METALQGKVKAKKIQKVVLKMKASKGRKFKVLASK